MLKLYRSLYAKVRARFAGAAVGTAFGAGLTTFLNALDVTALSGAEQAVVALVLASITGSANMYRRPEDHDPVRAHHTPGA